MESALLGLMLDSSVLIAAEGQKFRPGLLTVTKNGRRQSPSAFQELSKPSYKQHLAVRPRARSRAVRW
jgi:hypothetical protein